MKKTIVLLFFLFNSLNAQVFEQPDGVLWYQAAQSVYHSNQVSVLTGFLDGLNLGATVTMLNFPPNSICLKMGIEGYNQTHILDTLMLMNIQDQMSKFYSDTNNICIKIHHAFWIACLELSGESEKNIKKLLTAYRQKDCAEFMKKQKELDK